MQTTIIYITGIYDTLDLFTQELKNAFETMGYASFTYDARLEEESKQALIECIEEGTKKDQRFFCVTFNNLGYNLSLPAGMTGTGMLLKQDIFQSTAGSKRAGSAEEEPNLWETYNIPYINILMDHPFHYEKPIAECSGNICCAVHGPQPCPVYPQIFQKYPVYGFSATCRGGTWQQT